MCRTKSTHTHLTPIHPYFRTQFPRLAVMVNRYTVAQPRPPTQSSSIDSTMQGINLYNSNSKSAIRRGGTVRCTPRIAAISSAWVSSPSVEGVWRHCMQSNLPPWLTSDGPAYPFKYTGFVGQDFYCSFQNIFHRFCFGNKEYNYNTNTSAMTGTQTWILLIRNTRA